MKALQLDNGSRGVGNKNGDEGQNQGVPIRAIMYSHISLVVGTRPMRPVLVPRRACYATRIYSSIWKSSIELATEGGWRYWDLFNAGE